MVISPSGDAQGASTRSRLRGRRDLLGCGSILPGTRSRGPALHCSCSELLWHLSPGTSTHRAPAPLGPPAATFPQGDTLQGRQSALLLASPGSCLCPSPHWASLTPSFPSHPLHACPPPSQIAMPGHVSPLTNAVPLNSAFSRPMSHPMGVVCLSDREVISGLHPCPPGWEC